MTKTSTWRGLAAGLRAMLFASTALCAGPTGSRLRIGGPVTCGLDMSLTGCNLLDDHHPEPDAATEPGEVRRTVPLGACWKF